MAGRPKSKARKEAIARGEIKPGQSRQTTKPAGKAMPLTYEILERILVLLPTLASGDAANAAALSGVPRSDFRSWIAIGSQDINDGNRDTLHAMLVQGMEEQAIRKVEDRVKIIEGGTKEQVTVTTTYKDLGGDKGIEESTSETRTPGDWKAAAWLLERTSTRYQQRIRLELEKELNAMLELLERKLPPELFEQVMGIVAESEIAS